MSSWTFRSATGPMLPLLLAFIVFDVCGASGSPEQIISQRGRKFNPNAIQLTEGDAVLVVNDDGDLLHHAYIESDSFNFDSGDQKPGSRTRIVFSVPGDFKVLCGIHPKMKLTVHVSAR